MPEEDAFAVFVKERDEKFFARILQFVEIFISEYWRFSVNWILAKIKVWFIYTLPSIIILINHHINHSKSSFESFTIIYSLSPKKLMSKGSGYALRDMYKPGMSELEVLLYQMDQLIAEHSTDLYNHFNAQGFATSTFASRWFLTLFSAVFPKVGKFFPFPEK